MPECRATKVAGNAAKMGEPDIDACFRGRAIKLEVKRPQGAGATPLQLAVLQKWEDAGAIAKVVRSVQDVKGIIITLEEKESDRIGSFNR